MRCMSSSETSSIFPIGVSIYLSLFNCATIYSFHLGSFNLTGLLLAKADRLRVA
jgi:hypothetical protein